MVVLPDDSELIKNLHNGDVEAFDAIYEKYAKKIYLFSLKYLKNKEDSEELVQSIFLKIWENSGNLRSELSFKSYLFTIAYNEICKVFRKRNYHNEFVKSVLNEGSDISMSAVEGVDFQSTLEQVDRIIQGLPERQKAIFIKSRFDGKSSKEIAAELGLSSQTIDNYISEALKYIRNHLDKENLALLLLFSLFLN